MSCKEIQKQLFSLQDTAYRDFQSKILPTVAPEKIIGVRTPELRALAKNIARSADAQTFLSKLPHTYFDENQLHAFIICEQKSFDECISLTETFLPFIDNWATCDQLSPKTFKKQPERLLPYIRTWLSSPHTYTVRFGIGMLMQHFLDERFSTKYARMVAAVRSDEYYVNMMIAWYFATALAKQYDAVLPFITQKKLSVWTHNKAIQKATESYRITQEQKDYLRGLKIR